MTYADDTTLLTSGPTASDAQFSLQRLLQTVLLSYALTWITAFQSGAILPYQ